MIAAIDGVIGLLPLTTAFAVTGAFHPAAFETAENRQTTADYISSLMPERLPGTRWSGRAVDVGLEFSWVRRGVTSTIIVPTSICVRPEVDAVLRPAGSMAQADVPAAVLVSGRKSARTSVAKEKG